MFSVSEFNNLLKKDNLNYKVIYKAKTGSTNDDAIELVKSGKYINNTILISDFQTNARGRQINKWHSQPYSHLAFSLITNSKLNYKSLGLKSLMIGVSICEALSKLTNKNFNLKWPNDILFKNKKIAGILIETKQYNSNLVFIVGVGININEKLGDFTDDIKSKATSLNIILNKQHSREYILHSIIYRIKSNTKKINLIHTKWLFYCNHLNRKINFNYRNKKISGIFMGITNNGNAVININGINKIFQNAEILL